VSSETNFQHVLPAWLELASKTDVSLGLDPSEAFQRAVKLLNDLRSGQASAEGWVPEADQVEVLHALVALICQPEPADPKAALSDLELVFNQVSALPWPPEEFGGPRELLASCAFQAWRVARRFSEPPEIEKWLVRRRANSDVLALAGHALAVPRHERVEQTPELKLEDPELLLCVGEILRSRLETAPLQARDDAEFFYGFIDKPIRPISEHDECEYFLGELALTAGTASRFLCHIDQAKLWFQRAEANFALVQNADAHWARVAYQRLALAVEERRFQEVLDLAPVWAETFTKLGMPEDALKCHFLESAACWEIGEYGRAIEVHKRIYAQAESSASTRLLAQAAGNLVRYHAALGERDEALSYARKALPLMQQLGSHVPMVKLRWNVGELLRKQGNRAAALEAYRQAQTEARELGLRGDLAAMHLVVADLLLEVGQEAQAEREIRAALPIIEEEKMVPEGIAALSLLRESLRRQQIDHGALRDLHRHLEDRHR
jgi:tetratricopeptide (TPR) repeat protein